MHLYPYDYFADRPSDMVGLARTAHLIRAARAEAANALLLDNGDLLQGNPMGDFVAEERALLPGEIHPAIAAMNALELDAATIGNHDFNYGLEFLLRALSGAHYPVVLANALRKFGETPGQDETLLPPYTILRRLLVTGSGAYREIAIGVFGVVPPQILDWDRRHLEGRLQTRGIVDAASYWVPRIRAAGADLVIALAHSGIAAGDAEPDQENASVPLAAIEGIDAVLAGHSHLVFPGPQFDASPGVDPRRGTIHGKPAVMPGFWGSHLGVIDLLLEETQSGWRVAEFEARTRAIWRRDRCRRITPLARSAPAVLDSVRAPHEATLSYIRRPVGRSAVPLQSYFALVADSPALRVVCEAQSWYARRHIAGSPAAKLPLLSAAAPFKAGGRSGAEHYTEVPAGDIAIRNIADLYLYPNNLRVVRVSGRQLKLWLERAASIFHPVEPGSRDGILVDTGYPTYHFDVIDGLQYAIDLGTPPRFGADGSRRGTGGGRVTTLCHRRGIVADTDEFAVVTNTYRVSSLAALPGFGEIEVLLEAPELNRDVVKAYIESVETVHPNGRPIWRFLPMPNTQVIYETGPGAAAYLHTIAEPAMSPAGPGPDGFLRFRLEL